MKPYEEMTEAEQKAYWDKVIAWGEAVKEGPADHHCPFCSGKTFYLLNDNGHLHATCINGCFDIHE